MATCGAYKFKVARTANLKNGLTVGEKRVCPVKSTGHFSFKPCTHLDHVVADFISFAAAFLFVKTATSRSLRRSSFPQSGTLAPLCGLLVFFFCRKLFKGFRAAAVLTFDIQTNGSGEPGAKQQVSKPLHYITLMVICSPFSPSMLITSFSLNSAELTVAEI